MASGGKHRSVRSMESRLNEFQIYCLTVGPAHPYLATTRSPLLFYQTGLASFTFPLLATSATPFPSSPTPARNPSAAAPASL